jgi:glycine/D-amino acid oxidase-like deaminating enzyme
MHNGEISYWWRASGGFPPRRPSLPGPLEADVAIVGGGYTGLWTAYYLAGLRPELTIVVLEAAFAGYGASGRNGGWVTAEMPGSRAAYAKAPGGIAGVRALEAALRETVDEVGRVCAAESIDCDFIKGGRLSVATTPSQLARMREGLAALRERGDGSDVYEFLSQGELRSRVNVAGALAGLFTPASARVQPAALAAGIAAAAERRGVQIYEATPVSAIDPAPGGAGSGAAVGGRAAFAGGGVTVGAVARTKFGDVRARSVLRCTEGYTAALPGLRRALLPMNSHMIVTEPLSPAAWKEIGWDGCETLADEAHAYMYAQRTADGRIALGGRGVPYRYGSAVDHLGETDPSTVAALTAVLRRMFPAAASAEIAHAWCGVLGVPRDWCATVTYNPASGLGWAGGYTGHGVAAANLAGRTLADLVLGKPSPLTALPWVGHRSRTWEPEPARWAGVHGLYSLYRLADRLESPTDSGAGARLGEAIGRVGDAISGIPH